jgi:hypothetical protein
MAALVAVALLPTVGSVVADLPPMAESVVVRNTLRYRIGD